MVAATFPLESRPWLRGLLLLAALLWLLAAVAAPAFAQQDSSPFRSSPRALRTSPAR